MRLYAVLRNECWFLNAQRSHEIRRKLSKTVLVRTDFTKPNVSGPGLAGTAASAPATCQEKITMLRTTLCEPKWRLRDPYRAGQSGSDVSNRFLLGISKASEPPSIPTPRTAAVMG